MRLDFKDDEFDNRMVANAKVVFLAFAIAVAVVLLGGWMWGCFF